METDSLSEARNESCHSHISKDIRATTVARRLLRSSDSLSLLEDSEIDGVGCHNENLTECRQQTKPQSTDDVSQLVVSNKLLQIHSNVFTQKRDKECTSIGGHHSRFTQHSPELSPKTQARPTENSSVVEPRVDYTYQLSRASLSKDRKPAVLDGKNKPIQDPFLTYSRDPKWPHMNQPNLQPSKMLRAGFLFTGKGDMVTCRSCGVELDKWDRTMDPHTRHLNSRPSCRAAVGVPSLTFNHPYSYQSNDAYGISLPRESFMDEPGLPDYRNRQARLETFHGYSPSQPVSKHALAAAGFIFLKEPDFTKCFACGMILKGWERGVDPMMEHRKNAPGCPFVRSFERTEFAEPLPGSSFMQVDDLPFRLTDSSRTHSDTENLSLEASLSSLRIQHGKPQYFESTVCNDTSFPTKPKDLMSDHLYYNFPDFDGSGDEHETLKPQMSEGKSLDWSPDTSLSSICYPPTTKPGKSLDSLSPSPVKDPQAYKIGSEDNFADLPRPLSIQSKMPSLPQNSVASFSSDSDLKLCKVCMDRDIDAIFLPCGHVYCCSQCAEVVKHCPFCRCPVENITKAYLPF